MAEMLETFSELRRGIILALKRHGVFSIEQLSDMLGVTYEAVRQQIGQLRREGWVAKERKRRRIARPGRPRNVFRLTSDGDHLFPKSYQDLVVEIIDTMASKLEPGALEQILAALSDARVRRWRPLLEDLSLAQRLEALRQLYAEDDPFTEVERTEAGGWRLLERNCPFLDVARRHPALCSVTVSTLSRLLGYRVIREERFQNGDTRCAFRVLTERPIDPATTSFELEPALEPEGE